MVNKEELVNPFIKVIWEDTPENFTQEKIKRLFTSHRWAKEIKQK